MWASPCCPLGHLSLKGGALLREGKLLSGLQTQGSPTGGSSRPPNIYFAFSVLFGASTETSGELKACPCGDLLLYTFRGLTSFPALTLWVGGVSQRLSGSQCPVSFTSTNTLPSRAFPKLPVELSQDGGLLSSGTPDNCPYCWDRQYRHGDMPLGY